MVGVAFAALCCLGVTWALSALAAIGAGFLIKDAILIPLFLAFIGLSLWLLYRSARGRGDLRPLYLSAAGAAVALGGLFVTPVAVSAGLAAMVGGSLWDFALSRAARPVDTTNTV
jgi:predicted branched-subunit amino acid permease